MERTATVIQKAADLVAQFDHFIAAMKERAASFSGNAAGVNHSIEAKFEAFHVMLEQRKNVLLAEVQKEMVSSRENDIIELETKQRNIHSSLQQLRQLAIHESISDDNKCYQQLLAELTEAKQKLKETSDKFQIKFEGFLKPMANKIANYGQVVSGRGKKGDEGDFASAFAVLANQFEAHCQLQATRKDIKSCSEGNPSPLTRWFEFSKKLQWLHTTALSPETTIPDFESIFKKLKDDFDRNLSCVTQPRNLSDELYDKWLMPQEDRQDAVTISSEWLSTSHDQSNTDGVTRGFNAIVNSDSSSWLLHSDHDVSSKHDGSFNADTSPWLLQSSLREGKEMEDYQTWLTAGAYKSQPSEDDVNNLPQQGYSWMDHSRGTSSLNSEALPLGGDSGDDMNSDMFGSTQTLTSFGSSDFEVVDDTEM